MSMTIDIDYAKLSMSELHLCQLAIINEIRERDSYSHRQLEKSMKQSESLATQLEEAEQKKREAKSKQAALTWVLDEACRSLPDFDIQAEEELEQQITNLKDYAQQSQSEIEKMKVEHEAQIAELQLRIIPEIPPKVREQRHRDIQASAMNISDLGSSASKLLDESVKAWANLQDNPEVEKLQGTIKQQKAELDAVKAEIKTLPPMQKMLKVKHRNELQQ